ncbi:MAG: InlB B-repeat-containing protein [Rectinemataceae bacterium]
MAAKKQAELSTFLGLVSVLVLVLAQAACMLPTLGLAGTASFVLRIELGIGGHAEEAVGGPAGGYSRLVLPTAKSLTVVLSPKTKGLETKTQTVALQAKNLLNFSNLPIGSYTITATAYAGTEGKGAALFSQTTDFAFAPSQNYLGLFLLPLAPFAPDLVKSPEGQRVAGTLEAGQSATWQLPLEALPASGDFGLWVKAAEKLLACGQYGSGEPFTSSTGRSSAARDAYAKAGGYLTIYNAGSSAKSYEFITNPVYLDYDANGAGSGSVPIDSLGYLSGEKASATDSGTLAFAGKTFTGWNTLSDGRGRRYAPGDAVALTASLTLFAQWMDNATPTALVRFDSQGGSAIASATIAIGTTVNKPSDPTRANYGFGGWYKEQACTKVWDFTTDAVIAATTLYAKWTADSYVITYNLDGGTNAAGNPSVYTVETPTTTFAAATRAGYVFGGWFSDAAFNNQVTRLLVGSTGAVALFAKWLAAPAVTISLVNPVVPVVTFDGSLVSLSIAKAGSMTVTASGGAASGWLWTIDGSSKSTALGTNNKASIVVTADASLTLAIHQLVLFFDDADGVRHSASVSFKVTE